MQNDMLQGLEQVLGNMTQEEFKAILAEVDPVSWVETNRILKGKPFSFTDREYLLQPYRDEYKDLIFYKGRQVEMSEFSMNWLLRKLHKNPYTAGLHAFPRDNQAQKFSKQRLDPAIKDSPTISSWYDERGSEQKMRKFVKTDIEDKLKPYNFYILGATWESRKDTVGDASRGISLDFIVYDERQDHPDDVETVLGEGASHSDYGQTLTLGTPKLPGTQFDMQWESSDKHYWMVTCEHCGRTEAITMDNILDSGDEDVGYFYGCPKCKQPIIRSNGIWVPTNPQKRPQYRGYHINQLMVCWLHPNEIMKKFTSPTYPKRRFYNEVLGVAYGGDDVPITLQMMHNCTANEFQLGQSDGAIYVGVDWGGTSYCVLQNKTPLGHKMVDCMEFDQKDPREHPKRIAKYLKRYAPQIKKVVCDAGPDITRFYNLRDALIAEGVTRDVWACYYANPPAKTKISWNDNEKNVTVGRSEFIELIIDEVSDSFFVIPGSDSSMEKVEDLIDHFTNISAVKVRTQSGIEFITYQDTGPDHFLHAKLYSDVASYGGTSVAIGTTASAFKHARESSMVSQVQRLMRRETNKSSAMFPKFNTRRRNR